MDCVGAFFQKLKNAVNDRSVAKRGSVANLVLKFIFRIPLRFVSKIILEEVLGKYIL